MASFDIEIWSEHDGFFRQNPVGQIAPTAWQARAAVAKAMGISISEVRATRFIWD